jgi:hypothetical protein
LPLRLKYRLGLRHIPLCHFDCRAISCQVLADTRNVGKPVRYNDSNRLEAKIYILEELVRRKINIYELVEKDFDIQEKLNVEIGGCLALPSSKEKYRHILLRVYNDQLILSHFDDYGYKSKWNNFNELSELDYWNLPIKYKRYVKYIPYELKWINYYLVYIIIFLSLTVIFLLCKIKYIKIN